jgi:hypothetical protein
MGLLDRLPLRYGLVAVIVASEEDRAPFTPPKAGDYRTPPPSPHHPQCPCTTCHPVPERAS